MHYYYHHHDIPTKKEKGEDQPKYYDYEFFGTQREDEE